METSAYDRAPTVGIVANGATAISRASRAAASAGLRVTGRSDLAQAAEQPPTGTVLFVEVDADPDMEALARLLGVVASGRRDAIVSTPAALIDFVAAHAPDLVHQLADATEAERIAALALATAPTPLRVRDGTGDDAELIRLARLTEEVARIAAALARLSSAAMGAPPPPRLELSSEPPSEAVSAGEIRGLIRARRMRENYFDAELFADPAWDMLLDLAAAKAEADPPRVAVSSLCIAAAVPPTTALRWIRTLTDAGLFVRVADPADGRRVFIELGEAAAAGMRAYLSALHRLANAPGMGLAQFGV